MNEATHQEQELSPEQKRAMEIMKKREEKLQLQIGHLSMTNATVLAELEITTGELSEMKQKYEQLEKQIPKPAKK